MIRACRLGGGSECPHLELENLGRNVAGRPKQHFPLPGCGYRPLTLAFGGRCYRPMQESTESPLHPGAIADLISRLEEVAHLPWWERPNAIDDEHRLAPDLGRMRCLEDAWHAGGAAGRAPNRSLAPLGMACRGLAGHADCYPTRYSRSRDPPLVCG